MNEAITRNLLLPLHEYMRGRQTMQYYAELTRLQRLPGAEVGNLQQRKLHALIYHCRAHVPYYRQLLAEHGLPERPTAEEFSRLPPLEREDIRQDPERLKAEGFQQELIRYNTGGSTGAPLVFYTDKLKEARHNAYKLLCRGWFGIRPGDRQVDFWGSPIELDRQSRLRIMKDHWLLNQMLLSAFDLTEARLNHYVDYLNKFQPRLIYGYPTVTYRVARFIEETGRILRFRPRLVACTSEMLLDHQREVIGRVLKAPVANEYGARDAGLIAHECPCHNLHIAAGHVYVEVDQPDEDGVGDLLVTNLDGYGFPLLRYRVGDRGQLADGHCECGLGLPLMAELAGRRNDFVVGAGGKLIHSLGPVYVLREYPQIQQFKIIQQPDLSLEVEVVTNDGLTETDQAHIRSQMAKILGFEVDVKLQFVATISPEQSGKYRWVVSHAEGAAS